MARRAAVGTSFLLGCMLLAVYALSPIRTSYDSRWSIATTMSLLKGQSGFLTEYAPLLKTHGFYAIEQCQGRPRTVFPIGVSLLALPAVAVADAVDPGFEATVRHTIPSLFEQRVASFYGALACVVFFWVVFSQFRSVPIALATTLIFALCTPMWSTATRALWQHGPVVLMFAIAMLLLIQARSRPHLIQYLALPLAMAFVIRPTASIPITIFSAYVLLYYRAWFLRYLLWAAVIAIPWIAYNIHACGAMVSDYYLPSRLKTTTFGEALLGNMFSPGRGLFVFSPVLLLALSGTVLALRRREERPLYIAFCLVVVLHWITVSDFNHWWAGHSFGPRFMTDVVPILCFFVAFNFDLLSKTQPWKTLAVAASIALLAGASFFVHARGAFNKGTLEWNAVPTDVDKDHSRVWDWGDLQFLRDPTPTANQQVVLSTAVPPTPLSKPIAFNDQGEGRNFLGQGWSAPEWWGTWSNGSEAWLKLRLSKPASSLRLRLFANGFEPEAGKKQRVTVLFQDRRVGDLELGTTPEWFDIVLPASEFSEGEQMYDLHFVIERPTSPVQRSAFGLGINTDDQRLLGIGLQTLFLQAL